MSNCYLCARRPAFVKTRSGVSACAECYREQGLHIPATQPAPFDEEKTQPGVEAPIVPLDGIYVKEPAPTLEEMEAAIKEAVKYFGGAP